MPQTYWNNLYLRVAWSVDMHYCNVTCYMTHILHIIYIYIYIILYSIWYLWLYIDLYTHMVSSETHDFLFLNMFSSCLFQICWICRTSAGYGGWKGSHGRKCGTGAQVPHPQWAPGTGRCKKIGLKLWQEAIIPKIGIGPGCMKNMELHGYQHGSTKPHPTDFPMVLEVGWQIPSSGNMMKRIDKSALKWSLIMKELYFYDGWRRASPKAQSGWWIEAFEPYISKYLAISQH